MQTQRESNLKGGELCTLSLFRPVLGLLITKVHVCLSWAKANLSFSSLLLLHLFSIPGSGWPYCK